MTERLLHPKVVAKQLGISKSSIYRMIEEKQIKAKRVTIRTLRIPSSELERLMTGPCCDPDKIKP
jgi:excisionase family DNA binding protein